MKRISASFKGRVQGVGFRYFCYEKAKLFDITGWVKNEINGSVSLEAQGSEDVVDSYIQMIARGPSHSKVDELLVNERPPLPSEISFSILY